MQGTSDWELCKENIQPLKKGRVMADLQSALLPPGESSVRPKLLQRKREFEDLLRSYDGEDPLEPWKAYVDWTEQNFPKGGKEGSLSELLQHCILTFKDDPRYANDTRFVDICLKFADLAPDIMEVYQYLYSANIGVKTAAFFRSWALQHENLGNIKKAEALYVEGINRGAEPKEELEMSHKQFSARIINNMHEKVEQTSPQKSPEIHRTTLGGLKAIGKKHQVGSTRTGSATLGTKKGVQVQTNNECNAKARFNIYFDENMPQPSALPPTLSVAVMPPATSTAKKENERKADKWTDVKVRQRIHATPSTNQKAFSVHVDEICTPQQTPSQKVLPDSNILSSRKADFPNVLEGICRTTEPKTGCSEKAMYCKEKLFRGVSEFQFEELRAVKWRERQKKLDEEHRLQEREMRIKKKEDELENLTAKLRSIMAKGGDGMLGEVARCMKLMDDLKVDAQSDSSRSSSSDQLDGPKMEEAGENKMQQNIKGTDSNCSSAANSQTKTSYTGTPGSTGNTSHFVRAMFNGTIDEDAEGDTLPVKENITANPSSRKKCAFTIYGDNDAEVQALPIKELISKNPSSLKKSAFTVYGDDDAEVEALPVKELITANPSSQKKCAFTVYGDDYAQRGVGENNLGVDTKNGNNIVSSSRENYLLQNDENAAPVQPKDNVPTDANSENPQNILSVGKSSRKLAGILKQSTDVRNLADEDEIVFEVENDFIMEGVQPLASSDITMGFPSNTSFANNLKIFSTPCTFTNPKNITNQAAKSISTTQGENEQFFKTPGARSFAPTLDFQKFSSLHGKCDLSTISEASNEYKSSSSSSSSSAATSHFRSHYFRNKTQDVDTPSTVDRTNKSKVLGQKECPEYCPDPLDYSDPFKAEVTDAIVENLMLPLRSRKGYFELARPLPVFKENSHVQMANDTYSIDKLCNSGGFAKIFSGSEMSLNIFQNNKAKKLAFKVQKPACKWEFYIATELLSRIKQLKNPFDVTPSIMQISKMYVYKSGSILVTDYHNHGTLVDVVNHFTSRNQSVPEPLVLYLTIEMMHIIENLHACRIIHADVKPDNFLIMPFNIASINVSEKTYEAVFGRQTQCLKLIDFGRSIDMAVLPPGITFTKSVKTDMFECCEMKEGRPWTYQTDFYGLASCSHTLLFGSYMKAVKQGDSWKICSALKRYWYQSEWTNFFHQMLNIPNCDSQPNVAALRLSLQECLLSKKNLPELCSTLKQLEDVLGKKSGLMFS